METVGREPTQKATLEAVGRAERKKKIFMEGRIIRSALRTLGWAVLLAYLPLYLYRTRVEDKRDAARPDVKPTTEPPGSPAGAAVP